MLLMQVREQILPIVSGQDWADNPYGGVVSGSRLASAPYAISQLDIPAFYIVALFLLAYIIVLVPVNYYFLKARDKKEYAWVTTPAIVALFSIGAYAIGYGFKGGSTLLVRVGLVEARSGHDSAPHLTYAGLFSPRKTTYDVQLAATDAASSADAAATLLSEPQGSGPVGGLRIVQADSSPRVDEFGVDMWAMRVLKGEGVTRLGGGFAGTMRRVGKGITGEIRNNSPYTLESCRLVVGNSVHPVGDLGPGKTISVNEKSLKPGASGTLLPMTLLEKLDGSRDEQRIRRAVLQPLCGASVVGASGWQPPKGPMLLGWVKEPIARVQINGREPREQAATLMIVHLDQ
jgi:hypothetical protein